MNLLKGTTDMVTYRNGYKLFMKSKYLVSRCVLNLNLTVLSLVLSFNLNLKQEKHMIST